MKYLVTADTAKEQYATCIYLFGIFDTQEEALQFIKNWKPKRKDDSPLSYDFIKETKRWSRNDKTLEENLINNYIKEFDNEPICLAAYYE